MKVVHILDNLGRGGMETLLLDICRAARTNNFELILVLTGDGTLLKEFVDSGVELIKIRRKHFIDFQLIFKIRKLIKSSRIDIIHSHEPVLSAYVYLASLGLKVKTIMSVHGIIPKKKDDILRSLLIPRMDANITVSKAFLNDISDKVGYKVDKYFLVIHNGIDFSKFHSSSKDDLKKELKLNPSDLLLGMVGNFYNSGRDQLTICKALPELFRRFPSMYFVFIGGRSEKNPSYFDECYNECKKNGILDRTFFLGHRSNIPELIHSLDIYVYSSNHDSFGISVIEAMYSAIPVLINDLPSLIEVTNSGQFVNVFKTKDTNDLIYQVCNIFENVNSIRQRCLLAKQWVCSKYSINNYIENLKIVYENLLEQKHKSSL